MNGFTFQKNRTKATGSFYIDTINTHEGVDDQLATVGVDRITKAVAHNLHRHTWLNSDAIGRCPLFCGNSK